MLSFEEFDDIIYDVDEYYLYYSIPLCLLYFRIVYSIFNHCMHHNLHFPMFTGINGVLDISLFFLGNFFYRWPHEIRRPQGIYKYFNENSHFIGVLYFLMSAFHYSLFLSTLFMAFHVFSHVLFRNHWHKWWNNSLHRYVAKVFFIPALMFLDMAVSSGYFRYITDKEEYFLMLSSPLPPIMTRIRGLFFLTVVLALTFILLLITALAITITLIFTKRTLVNHELSNYGVAGVFASCRLLFLYYQYLTFELRATAQMNQLFILGRSFPVWNDVICLSPALLTLIISKPIRRLAFPALYWRKHQVHVEKMEEKEEKMGEEEEKEDEKDGSELNKKENEEENEENKEENEEKIEEKEENDQKIDKQEENCQENEENNRNNDDENAPISSADFEIARRTSKTSDVIHQENHQSNDQPITDNIENVEDRANSRTSQPIINREIPTILTENDEEKPEHASGSVTQRLDDHIHHQNLENDEKTVRFDMK
ncbi:unnamed protein product [Bursaphelenchus xylophilus]|uniref:Serpentine receptor class gamma n=1 Tax=Bursaphelenchus xylophilus TaxID=6326 RepID=A0A1I7S5A7_BURXY|nr:unnamed protein product [Bursaphelenchus xylophilus]CAG9117876.1 unnamed protein product [Bursaphelenchus xylophilus]